jgi:rubredoxin-NAD+ reductase
MADPAALPVVIAGSGLAGYTAAREFRKLDKQTPLVVVSRDHAGFYSKPMLSNALASKKTAATLVMKTAATMAEELPAIVLMHAEVRHIDTAARALHLADGTTIAYRNLVLALGADPIRLPLEGDGAADVLSVNDLDDYARFAERLEGVAQVAILGGGLIGCEFANDLLARGVTPVVIDPAAWPLSRLLPPAAGAWLKQRLEAAGASFRFGAAAVRVDRVATGYALTLTDGSRVEAGLVLSAIGLRPRTGIAKDAGLAVGRGIVTDLHLHTSAAHVYALGDCAEVVGHTLPYVLPIMQQARALAATLTGTPTAVTYPAMPVVVKTPACPTVVCPPPMDVGGQWQVQAGADALEARFVDADGALRGFALMGGATTQRQALAALVPALLA